MLPLTMQVLHAQLDSSSTPVLLFFFVCEPADSVTVFQLGRAQCANGSGDCNDMLHHHHPNEDVNDDDVPPPTMI